MNAKSKQDFEPVTEVKEGRKNVYAVLKVMKGNYWEEVIRGIKDGAAKADVNVYVGGVMKDGDWELQRDMVKELPGKKADAVILAPADSSNMTASAKTLREQKLPVFWLILHSAAMIMMQPSLPITWKLVPRFASKW